MRIAISCESTIDLPKNLLEQYDIKTVPFTVYLGEEEFLDGDMDINEIFKYVRMTNKLPKTSAVNESQYEQSFSKLLKEYDYVIHMCLSSKISSAYNHCVNAASKFENVYVMDTKSLSTGIALLAIYGSKLVKEGLDPLTIYQKIEARRDYVQASFILNQVEYLYKGGRCSAIKNIAASILKLKPIILVKEGAMNSSKVLRGNENVIVDKYVDYILENFTNPDLDEVFITYTTTPKSILDQVEAKLIAKGFKHIMRTQAGATISSYCGESCMGILFINDGGNK